MRPHRPTKVDGLCGLAVTDIDYGQGSTVGAGFADPRVPIDGNVGSSAVRRSHDLMAGCPAHGHRRNLPSRVRIDNPQPLIALIGDQQPAAGRWAASWLGHSPKDWTDCHHTD